MNHSLMTNVGATNVDAVAFHEHHGESEYPAGTLLRAAGQLYRVMEGSQPDSLLIQDVASKDMRRTTPSFLNLAIAQGSMMVAPDDEAPTIAHMQYRMAGEYDELIEQIPTSIRSEAAISMMLEKKKWLGRLQKHHGRHLRNSSQTQMVLKELERQYGEECPLRVGTLYRDSLTVKKNGGRVAALLPRFDLRGGRGGKRLGDEVELIVNKVLTSMGNKSGEMLQASRAHHAVLAAVNNANIGRKPEEQLRAPSEPTIGRRFKTHFDAYDVACRNFGKPRADVLFRRNGYRIRAARALDVVQYDDTDTCVFLVDERSALPWGRCWLTAGVDEHSASVTGVSIDHLKRSTVSAHEAVMHSLAPKDHSSSDFDLCAGRWHAYGNQGLVLLDNASYNASHDFQASLIDLDLQFEFARPGHPTNKPGIEHWNHRLKSDFCSQLPGWSGAKEDRELLGHGIGTAVLSIGDFRKQLFRWIVDDYSNMPMQWGKSPRQLWDETFAFHEPFLPRRMPSDELLGTISSTLTFRDSGVLLRKLLRYDSTALTALLRRIGQRGEVNIRYRPRALDFIYVEDSATQNYLKVPCIEDPATYQGLTDFQWSLVLKRARSMFGKNVGLSQAAVAREALVADTRRLMFSKRMSERKRAVTTGDLPASAKGSPTSEGAAPCETVVVSDLEAWVHQMEEDNPDDDPDMQVVMYGEEA